MKARNPAALAALVAVLALVAGCATVDSRARQMGAVYEGLPPEQQERLQRGAINLGDTPEMVYIALGNPDGRRDILNADGTRIVWVYRTYWQSFEGTDWLGYRRLIVPARHGRGFAILHEPIRRELYRTHADEVIRVTFVDRRVVEVEQRIR